MTGENKNRGAAIKTEKLCKKYGSLCAVDSLDLTVYEGELFALLGVNGAGKTTTVKMLSCLAAPTSGDAFVMGKSIVKESAEVKRIIGVSPQETAVAPNLSVRENLELMDFRQHKRCPPHRCRLALYKQRHKQATRYSISSQ